MLDTNSIKVVLALDPARSTGYALAHVDSTKDTADIYEYGIIDIPQFDYNGDMCIYYMDLISDLIKKHSVDHIVVEDYMVGRMNKMQGVSINLALRTAIHIQARKSNIYYTIAPVSSWKKLVSGRTTPTIDQKRKWGKEPAKKLMIQEALWLRYGFKLHNHSISSKTGKPIKFRYDVVDAIGQLIYCLRGIMDIREVTLSVDPEEIVWDKEPKGLYKYGENNE